MTGFVREFLYKVRLFVYDCNSEKRLGDRKKERVSEMDERRKNTRSKLESKLLLKRLDKDEKEVVIEVADVSKTGVGFVCNEPLMIGAVYETYLTIWTKEIVHACVEIVRIEKVGDTYNYGGFFVGMPDMDSARIEVYQMFEQESNKE